jgi:thiamine monophosphate kinase
MAQKIATEMVPHLVKSLAHEEYNWEQYDDGEHWQLRRGDDYAVQTQSAKTAAKKWAKDHNKRAEIGTLKEGDGFVLRFVRR